MVIEYHAFLSTREDGLNTVVFIQTGNSDFLSVTRGIG
jgi:hypothetical protein